MIEYYPCGKCGSVCRGGIKIAWCTNCGTELKVKEAKINNKKIAAIRKRYEQGELKLDDIYELFDIIANQEKEFKEKDESWERQAKTIAQMVVRLEQLKVENKQLEQPVESGKKIVEHFIWWTPEPLKTQVIFEEGQKHPVRVIVDYCSINNRGERRLDQSVSLQVLQLGERVEDVKANKEEELYADEIKVGQTVRAYMSDVDIESMNEGAAFSVFLGERKGLIDKPILITFPPEPLEVNGYVCYAPILEGDETAVCAKQHCNKAHRDKFGCQEVDLVEKGKDRECK